MKRGRIGVVIAVILAAAMLLTFTLAACNENSHEHSLTHVDARESTCTSGGNIEHWQCTSCGKYFKDADATIEATWGELQLPLIEHDYDPATHCCKNCGSYDNEGAQTALSYELNEQKDGYIVSSCGSSATSVEIPDEINGLPVVGIKGGAFENRSNLTSVTIGNNVTSIGSWAFSGCSGLTSITIPDSVTSIDSYAFSGCSGLTSITIPDSVTSIGYYAFSGCVSLTSVTIPDSMTSIDSYAFSGCSGLTSIVVPNSVTSIGKWAFSGCSGLTSIVIPDSVTSIGEYAFYECSGLTSITIPFVGEKADGTGARHFSYIFGTSINGMNYYLPESLKEVIITGGTSIGDYAFFECSGLTSITIPDSVTSIGYAAFEGCSGLTSVTIGDGVEEIGSQAFYGCTSLSSVNIPNSVKEIGSNAFKDCISLQSIFLPITVHSVGQGAFSGCSQLTIMCEAKKVNWSYEWNGGCKVELGCNAVNTNTDYDYVLHDGKAYLTAYKGDDTDITVPTAIDGYDVVDFGNAYQGNTEIVRVVIPEGFTRVESYAFADCSKLTELILPEGLIEFGYNAIYWTQVAKLSFPSSMVKIDGESFNVETPLIIDIPTIEDWLEVTRSTQEGYSWSSNYNLYINGESAETIVIPSSVTEIGRYAFNNFGNIKTVILHDGVTSIGDWAFFRCSGLTSITIPDGVTSIGYDAFWECSGLTSVTIGNGVTSIGSRAFSGCSGLTSVTIPDSVTSISSSAFSGCSGLTSIVVEDGNPVYHSAGNCIIATESKTLILGCNASVIPNDGSVTSIGDDAFDGCSGLTSITIPDSVTSIGSYAFSGCGINEIVIPIGVTHIGAYAIGANHYWETCVIKCEADSRPSDWDENWTSCVVVWGYPENDIATDGNKYYTDDLGITYLLRDGNATVVGVAIGENGELTIPGQIEYNGNSYVVTEIAEKVLYDHDDLTSITIPFVGEKADGTGATHFGYIFGASNNSLNGYYVPESLKEVIITGGTSIGYEAFYGCSGLTSITIPDSVTSIGSWVFDECSGLTEVYYQGDLSGWLGIEFADSSANPMVYTKNVYIDGQLLQGDIVIPDGTEKIGDYAFYNCSGLTSVTIHDSVTSIGEYAFSGCDSLTSITIPDSVRSIGYETFSGCSGLTSITIPFVGEKADGSGEMHFGYIFGAESCWVAEDHIPSSLKEVVVTGGTSIGERAFYECSSLTSITIPDSVTSIGDDAFYNCSSLINIIIPDSVTSIGDRTFSGCSGLTSITIGNGMTSIGGYAFDGVTAEIVWGDAPQITSIDGYAFARYQGAIFTIPGSVTSIGRNAFMGCDILTTITISDSVTSIGHEAFYGCSGLTSVTIPGSVTSIGSGAFSACYKLVEVYNKSALDIVAGSYEHGNIGAYAKNVYTEEGGSQFTDIDGYRFFYDGEDGYFMGYYGADTELTLPSSFVAYDRTVVHKYEIHEYALDGCDNLTSVTIPDSVTSIGEYAFSGVTAEIVWGDAPQITSMGYHAFSGYQGTTFTIPDSVTSIGLRAFEYCNSLTSIVIPDSVTSIDQYAFDGCNGIIEIENGVSYVDGWVIGCDGSVTSVELREGTRGVANFAFAGCGSLQSVTIPDSVTSIGEYAFFDCSGLTSITIPFVGEKADGTGATHFGYIFGASDHSDNERYTPESLKEVIITGGTSIGSNAFRGCSGLTSIVIPDSVTSIGEYAFYGCSGLTSLVIPDSVTSIGISAFYGCSGLTDAYYQGDLSRWLGIGFYNSYANPMYYSDNLYINGELLQGDIVIPGGTRKIGDYVFFYCSNLTSIAIPDSVTSIGERAFVGCSGLTSITIGNGVTSIGSYAFSGCSGLTSVTIPDRVTRIGEYAFRGVTAEIVWGDAPQITSIGDYAFSGYQGTTFTIPDSVTRIGKSAFSGCSGLTSVTIPDSVTSIGNDAFADCSGLTNITIPDSVTSIGERVFYNCSGLTSVTIPNSVTSIGDYAFSGCSELTSIAIPDSVTSIGEQAFDGVTAEIIWGDAPQITSIGDYAFSGYQGTTFTIPDSVTSIGSSAFSGCSGLTSIAIPDSVSNIVEGAFFGSSGIIENENGISYVDGWVIDCDSSITSVELRDGTRRIANYAFEGCGSLQSVTIPDSVKIIGDVFSDCSGLTSITIPFVGEKADGAGATHFGYIFGAGSYSDNERYTPESLKEVIITGGTSIGDEAFYECSGLTSVTILDSVTSIGSRAFSGCSGLTSIIIPDSVTSIGDAFDRCSSLTSITIPFVGEKADGTGATHLGYLFGASDHSDNERYVPKSLKEVIITGGARIDNYTFYRCSGLTSITIGNGVINIGDYAFYGCSNLTDVYYQGDLSGWLGIEFDASPMEYADNLYINGVLLQGDIDIPNGTEKIGDYAFYNCSGLTSITIPDSVTSIGRYAFYGATAEIVWGDNPQITSIDSYAFSGYQGKNLTIPDSVTSIGVEAFYGCSGLTSITIPDSVKRIAEYTFTGCSGLTSITIPDSVLSIYSYAFADCSGLTSITIPDSVISIGQGAFDDCSGLTSIVIPDSVKSIDYDVFSGCSGLTSIVIPDSVKSIGDRAFNRCSGLTTINFQGTMAQWQAIEKGPNWDNLTGEYAVICTDGTISKADA